MWVGMWVVRALRVKGSLDVTYYSFLQRPNAHCFMAQAAAGDTRALCHPAVAWKRAQRVPVETNSLDFTEGTEREGCRRVGDKSDKTPKFTRVILSRRELVGFLGRRSHGATGGA
ncbi:hypothetical protein E2C01_049197 [Portunus trituberculatus]|uniref:Uncharacterized protein n=1 Tax=Portunus trituberculatus TaxID=210409 RepID=A0A5B7GD19_PORTR|nr:hypothetical protein [Portunus trituberculatus]